MPGVAPEYSTSRCPVCGYDLAGLGDAATCPECGGRLDWAMVRRGPGPRLSRSKAWALIACPHFAEMGVLALFQGGCLAAIAMEGVTLAYFLAGPLCTMYGVHQLNGGVRTTGARIAAAILGLFVFVLIVVVTFLAAALVADRAHLTQ